MKASIPSKDSRLLALVEADSPSDPESEARLQQGRVLIESGCDLMAHNCWGETAFLVAIRYGFLPWVELFISHGLKISETTTLVEFLDKSWPRHPTRSQRHSFAAILTLFLAERPDLSGVNDNGLPLLVIAAKEGNTQGMAALLEAGADPNVRSACASTALETLCNFAWRARTECLNAIETLIAFGAEPNNPHCAQGINDKSALHWALYAGGNSEAVINALLAAGADPRAVDSEGLSALAYARNSRRPDLVKLIEMAILHTAP
jgi:ankyrin repeat protein